MAKSAQRLFRFCLAILFAVLISALIVLPVADSQSESAPGADETHGSSPPAAPKSRILFVLMCQTQLVSFHKERCALLRKHIEDQAGQIQTAPGGENQEVSIALAEDLVDAGIETFFYLPMLVRNHSLLAGADFVFFCHEETRMKLAELLNLLASYNSSEPVFLGSPLRDEGYYIVHHFSQSRHLYPFIYCGFAMSKRLVASLASHFRANQVKLGEFEFRIDPVYELASLISLELQLANLTAVSAMCPRSGNLTAACVTWTTDMFRLPHCAANDSAVSALLSRTLFAVKTHKANFDAVLSVVRDTWAKQTAHIVYYADVEDPEIPTVACGVPNTERGHCDKLNRILHLLAQSQRPARADKTTGAAADSKAGSEESSGQVFDWFVIADDDTLLSPKRLARLLACYSGDPERALVVGEKYGYLSADGRHGYAYPTGGSGFALNRAALLRLASPDSAGVTRCGSAESPDDMSLGVWLRALSVPVLHSHLLHQARSSEYPPALLAAQLPVSFHKHLDSEPRLVYRQLLAEPDEAVVLGAARDEL